MKTNRRAQDDHDRLSDELWSKIESLIPVPASKHPLGCHRPRVCNRRAMDAILFVLRTGCPWNALNETGICTSSSAHRRFQEGCKAGVFEHFWQQGLTELEALNRIDWTWLSCDGATTKAPLSGQKKQEKTQLTVENRALSAHS